MTNDAGLTKRISLIIQNEISSAGPYAAYNSKVVEAIGENAAKKIVAEIPDNSIEAVEDEFRTASKKMGW